MQHHFPTGVPTLRIAIAGAGLSGLALAQALRRYGILAQIYERDANRQVRSQGYRLRIDSSGQAALRECLRGEDFDRFLAACAPTMPLASHNAQLSPIATPWTQAWELPQKLNEASPDLRVDRGLMRDALMHGLETQLHWGHELLDCQILPSGQAGLRFANGQREAFDLLVVANGAHSALKLQPWLEKPQAVGSCIYGLSDLSAPSLQQLPEGFLSATQIVVDPAAVAIVDAMRFAAGTSVPDYLYWALLLPEAPTAGHPLAEGQALHRDLRQRCQHWAAPLRAIFANTAPSALRAVPVFSGGRLDEDQSALSGLPIIAIGDAVHLMSPAGGLGANTALQDAAELARTLVAMAQQGIAATELTPILAPCEQRLRQRANAAMAASNTSHQALCQLATATMQTSDPQTTPTTPLNQKDEQQCN